MRVYVTILILVNLFITSHISLFAESRERIDLDGSWEFALDPHNLGESEQWFLQEVTPPKDIPQDYGNNTPGTIMVPGAWDVQGYGKETQKTYHTYSGKGWYRRTFFVPETWQNCKVRLTLEGIARYAKVWINGKSAGPEAIGHCGPHTWEVDSLLTRNADNFIAIQIDSRQRMEIDPLRTIFTDFMNDVCWGGLSGHVFLEARANIALESFILRSNIKRNECQADCVIENHTGEPEDLLLTLELFDTAGERAGYSETSFCAEDKETHISLAAQIEDAQLWSLDTPYLYKAQLSVRSGSKTIDQHVVRYGLREFQTEGSRLLLNGKPIMLVGCGDDDVYPEHMSCPCDKDFYLKRLRCMKSFGFNHVRHHSTILPQEYYDACDELGMLTTAEFAIGYWWELPEIGKTWLARVPKGTDPEPGLACYRERWRAVVKNYRNHPSILCWVMGNELWEGKSIRLDFQKIAKDLDPDRFFNDSDGDYRDYIINNDRDTLDLYMILFDVHCSPILVDNDKYTTGKLKKPAISHEEGNYVSFPRPSEIHSFKGNIKPFWMTDGIEKLTKMGLVKEGEEWAEASEKLYLLHYKAGLEALRSNPELSGYHWWLFQDYWSTSNGLVDVHFNAKTHKPDEVRSFNNVTVLLQKGVPIRCTSGETLVFEFFISNYSGRKLCPSGVLKVVGPSWKKEIPFSAEPCENGTNGSIYRYSYNVPLVEVPSPLKIEVEVTDNGQTWRNCWETWIFPEQSQPQQVSRKYYVERGLAIPPYWDIENITYNKGEKLDANAVYLVSCLSDEIIDALVRGAGVVCTDATSFLPAIKMEYKQTWWKAGVDQRTNNCGTFLYSNGVTDGIASDNWCQKHWFYLIESGKKYNLDEAPCRPEIMIRALPSLCMVQDLGLLFRVGVGQGTLCVSGLNHLEACAYPENAWLLARLLEHVASSPAPKEKWPREFLKSCTEDAEGTGRNDL